MSKTKQLPLALPIHGGKRRGAGRRPKGDRAFVSHRARPRFETPTPRFGVRLVEYSVLGNHLHLIVEANDSASLSRGMQGLCIRIARGLNALLSRQGSVFDDHFHSPLLRTPAELCGVIRCVRGSAAHHYDEHGADLFSSAAADALAVLAAPVGWLLRIG